MHPRTLFSLNFFLNIVIVFRVLQTLENNKNRLVNSHLNSVVLACLETTGKTLALVYEILLNKLITINSK